MTKTPFIHQQRGRAPNWRSPFEWTDAEVHALVEKELGVGSDTLFATGWQVYIKLWEAPEYNEMGIHIPEVLRANSHVVVGKILGFGGFAMRDPQRFPDGATHTYGEWATFRPYSDQKQRINGKLVAMVTDDQFVGLSTDPAHLQSVLMLEDEYRFAGD